MIRRPRGDLSEVLGHQAEPILEPSRLTNRSTGSFGSGNAGSGIVRLPGADEPTIGITMPMTDKPVCRGRYRVKGEQKNEIGRVRRDDTRRDGRADI
jgi:hypothetical protein